MNHLKPIVAIYLVFFLSAGALSAQPLRIIKDNIACTYGLKNQAGDWVVNAQFTLIENLNHGYFLTTAGLSHGLLGPDGTEVIPPKYDFIRWFASSGPEPDWGLDEFSTEEQHSSALSPSQPDQTYFLVHHQQKLGLIDGKGVLRFPIDFSDISQDRYGNLVLYRNSEAQLTSLYVSLEGDILIPEFQGFLLPFQENLTLFMRTVSSTPLVQKMGVIHRSGNIILRSEYDHIALCSPNKIMVSQENRIGVMDSTGKVRIAPTYELANYPLDRKGLPCFSDQPQWKVEKDGKLGLLSSEGTLVLPTEYDALIPKEGENSGTISEWIAVKNGKYGIINAQSEILIPCEYDSLLYLPKPAANFESTLQPEQLLLYTKKGKLGLITSRGKLLSAPEYDHYFLGRKDLIPVVYLSKGKKMDWIMIHPVPSEIRSMDLFAREDSLYIFWQQDRLVGFTTAHGNPKQLTSKLPGSHAIKQQASLVYLNRAKSSMLFGLKGRRLDKGQFSYLTSDGTLNMLAQLHSGKQGILSSETLEWVIDTQYVTIQTSQYKTGWTWAKRWAKNPTLDKLCGEWDMLNSKGTPVLKEVFDTPFEPLPNAIALVKGKMGVLNPFTPHWLLLPTFDYLEPRAEGLFLVINESGKQGLIYTNGEFLADTVYDAIEEIYSDYPFQRGDTLRPHYRSKWWLLKKGDSFSLVSTDEEWIRDPDSVFQKRKELAFSDPMLSQTNLCNTHLSIRYNSSEVTYDPASEIFALAFDTANAIFEQHKMCQWGLYQRSSCVSLPEGCPEPISQRMFHLDYIDANAFSLKVSYFANSRQESRTFEWINCLIIEGKPQCLSLTDIFGSGTILEDELVAAIRKRDELELDCSTPANLVDQLDGRFCFSKAGIKVILRQAIRWKPPVELILPWENLLQHETTKKMVSKWEHN